MANENLKQFLDINGLNKYTVELLKYINSKGYALEVNTLKIANVNSKADLPSIGDDKTIYVTTGSTKRIYLFNVPELKYYCFGSDYNEIERIDGGTSKANI